MTAGTGRRTVLIGGPDVRAVIRGELVRRAEPDRDAAGVDRAWRVEHRWCLRGLVEVVVRYWSSYPDEIDAWIADADALEVEAVAA